MAWLHRYLVDFGCGVISLILETHKQMIARIPSYDQCREKGLDHKLPYVQCGDCADWEVTSLLGQIILAGPE